MEQNEYDLFNFELIKESIDELEDDLLNEVIAKDTKSRNTLNLIYFTIGLFD